MKITAEFLKSLGCDDDLDLVFDTSLDRFSQCPLLHKIRFTKNDDNSWDAVCIDYLKQGSVEKYDLETVEDVVKLLFNFGFREGEKYLQVQMQKLLGIK